ncbi:tail fiber domain-containing protein [Burkholderia multivorans]|uniref:tail fiber domain-containing protein n=1 Tax=Burkholderia multivorans TaxID=87883 RepID=UPI0020189EDF|nr:tail fiber domain-containing protein [Burkholderia multivorans]MCO1343396.1 tail fiber domain-containing protein [Burkholderia multivorans]MCO1443858.1 tail fiber domain-containing protein [Burkholderia multivorans]UQO29367.1 tail fiber domain-containing protein [Burkholderia multivorans]
MELSLILSDDTETYQAILGQFIESSAAETHADRILAQQAAETATNSANSALDSAGQAAQSAAASADSATQASASAAAASTSEQHASQYATAAQAASTDAAGSASSAASSASSATLSATSAANSATAASVSEQNAAATLANALKKANNLSDVADAATALANLGGAPKANPTFTGNVGVPTRAAGDNGNYAASTAFVAASFLPRTGGTLTGTLLLNGPTQGSIPSVQFQLNGKSQWGVGDNGGGWFVCSRYDANGSWINDPLQLDPSGKTWINGDAQVGGSLLLGNSRGICFKRTDGNYHIAMQLTADSGNNTDIINCDGGGRIRFLNEAYNAELGWFDNNGNFWARGDIQGFSDRRVKSNIKRIKGAMAKVRELVGVTFTRRRSKDKTRHMGFIAQDVEPIVPEVVHTDEKGMKSIAYANMTALLAEALKELDERVAALEAGE